MRRKKFGLIVLATALLFMLSMQATSAEPDTSTASQSWQVNVGKALSKEAEVFNMFPSTLIIHEGDSVTFTNNGTAAPHTVTFWGSTTPPAPENLDESYAAPNVPSGSAWDGKTLLNSGIFFPGQSYSATFSTSGVYPYLCLLHPNMTGTIIVIPKGQPILSKADQLAAQTDQLKAFGQQVAAVKKDRAAPTYVKNKDGSLTYAAYAGSGTQDLMVNLYSPNALYINEGDSIQWVTDSHDFQFVFFNTPKDFSAILPNGDLNPLLESPAGGPEFDGKEAIRSGMIMPDMPFTLKFTKAGTYMFSDPVWGKSGKVVVAPKGAAKLILNGSPVVTDVQAKQGTVYVPSSFIASVTKAKLVVGKDLAKTTIQKKTYVSLAELIDKIGGTYAWNAVTKTATVTTK